MQKIKKLILLLSIASITPTSSTEIDTIKRDKIVKELKKIKLPLKRKRKLAEQYIKTGNMPFEMMYNLKRDGSFYLNLYFKVWHPVKKFLLATLKVGAFIMVILTIWPACVHVYLYYRPMELTFKANLKTDESLYIGSKSVMSIHFEGIKEKDRYQIITKQRDKIIEESTLEGEKIKNIPFVPTSQQDTLPSVEIIDRKAQRGIYLILPYLSKYLGPICYWPKRPEKVLLTHKVQVKRVEWKILQEVSKGKIHLEVKTDAQTPLSYKEQRHYTWIYKLEGLDKTQELIYFDDNDKKHSQAKFDLSKINLLSSESKKEKPHEAILKISVKNDLKEEKSTTIDLSFKLEELIKNRQGIQKEKERKKREEEKEKRRKLLEQKEKEAKQKEREAVAKALEEKRKKENESRIREEKEKRRKLLEQKKKEAKQKEREAAAKALEEKRKKAQELKRKEEENHIKNMGLKELQSLLESHKKREKAREEEEKKQKNKLEKRGKELKEKNKIEELDRLEIDRIEKESEYIETSIKQAERRKLIQECLIKEKKKIEEEKRIREEKEIQRKLLELQEKEAKRKEREAAAKALEEKRKKAEELKRKEEENSIRNMGIRELESLLESHKKREMNRKEEEKRQKNELEKRVKELKEKNKIEELETIEINRIKKEEEHITTSIKQAQRCKLIEECLSKEKKKKEKEEAEKKEAQIKDQKERERMEKERKEEEERIRKEEEKKQKKEAARIQKMKEEQEQQRNLLEQREKEAKRKAHLKMENELLEAAKKSKEELKRLLLNNKYSNEVKNQSLCSAIEAGNSKNVDYLIKYGFVDEEGLWKGIYSAALLELPNIIELFPYKAREQVLIYFANRGKTAPISQFNLKSFNFSVTAEAITSHQETYNWFLVKEKWKDQEKGRILSYAVINKVKSLDWLLKREEINTFRTKAWAIYHLAKSNNKEKIKDLIDREGFLNEVQVFSVLIAALERDVEVVDFLLEFFKKETIFGFFKPILSLVVGDGVNVKDKNGKTVLHDAAEYGYQEIAKFLLDAGANIEARNERGETPLYTAVKYNKKEVLNVLIYSGANPDARSKSGVTPLDTAAGKNRKEVAGILIKAKADVNAKDGEGMTPLHTTALTNSKEVAKVLINANADINAKDKNGRTPLQTAKYFKNKEMIKLLEKYAHD